MNKKNLLICFTGSVATIKDHILIEIFQKIVYTKSAQHFSVYLKQKIKSIKYYTEEDEWKWKKKGDRVLHIYLQEWSHIILIAPLSANTLAKICNGICDNTITLVIRALKLQKKYNSNILNYLYKLLYNSDQVLCKKVFICPAMNTNIYYKTSQYEKILEYLFQLLFCQLQIKIRFTLKKNFQIIKKNQNIIRMN